MKDNIPKQFEITTDRFFEDFEKTVELNDYKYVLQFPVELPYNLPILTLPPKR